MTQPNPDATAGQSAVVADPGQSAGQVVPPTAAGASGTDPGQSAQPAPPTGVSREEFDAVYKRMQAADQRATQREAELKQLKEKDMPELQRLQAALAEKDTALIVAKEATDALTVQNAFLTDNSFDWHNPASAMQLLNREKIAIVDGKVTGMKDALTTLSKEHPYLLKPKVDPDAPEPDATPAGTPPMNAGGSSSTKPNKEAMMKRFPAMRTRIGGSK